MIVQVNFSKCMDIRINSPCSTYTKMHSSIHKSSSISNVSSIRNNSLRHPIEIRFSVHPIWDSIFCSSKLPYAVVPSATRPLQVPSIILQTHRARPVFRSPWSIVHNCIDLSHQIDHAANMVLEVSNRSRHFPNILVWCSDCCCDFASSFSVLPRIGSVSLFLEKLDWFVERSSSF